MTPLHRQQRTQQLSFSNKEQVWHFKLICAHRIFIYYQQKLVRLVLSLCRCSVQCVVPGLRRAGISHGPPGGPEGDHSHALHGSATSLHCRTFQSLSAGNHTHWQPAEVSIFCTCRPNIHKHTPIRNLMCSHRLFVWLCRLFFRRHYAVNTVIFCSLDLQGRKWVLDTDNKNTALHTLQGICVTKQREVSPGSVCTHEVGVWYLQDYGWNMAFKLWNKSFLGHC